MVTDTALGSTPTPTPFTTSDTIPGTSADGSRPTNGIADSRTNLKLGYWQVEMDEESKQLTAFTVGPLGFYECERIPFGLTNTPYIPETNGELSGGPQSPSVHHLLR